MKQKYELARAIGLMVISKDHKVEVAEEAEGKNLVYLEPRKW
jgi:hypothetical protein